MSLLSESELFEKVVSKILSNQCFENPIINDMQKASMFVFINPLSPIGVQHYMYFGRNWQKIHSEILSHILNCPAGLKP